MTTIKVNTKEEKKKKYVSMTSILRTGGAFL